MAAGRCGPKAKVLSYYYCSLVHSILCCKYKWLTLWLLTFFKLYHVNCDWRTKQLDDKMLSRQKKRTTKYLTLSLFPYKNENCAKESTKGKTLINRKIKLMEEIHKCSYILFGWADESIYKFGLSILHFTIFPNFLISLTHGIKALFIYRSWGSSPPFICVMDEKRIYSSY